MGCGNSKTSEVIVPHSAAVIETPIKVPAKAAPAAPPAKAAPSPTQGASTGAPLGAAPRVAAAAPGRTAPEPVPTINLGRVVGGDASGGGGAYVFTPRVTPTPRFIPFQGNPTEYGSKVFLGQVAQQVRGHGALCGLCNKCSSRDCVSSVQMSSRDESLQYLAKYGLSAEVLKDYTWTKDESKANKGMQTSFSAFRLHSRHARVREGGWFRV